MACDQMIWSLGIVCKRLTLPNLGMLGTCFPLNSPQYFLTAAHCLEGTPDTELALQTLGLLSKRAPVVRVSRHPKADVAVLKIEPSEDHNIEPLHLSSSADNFWGEPVASFGFPADRTYLGLPDNYVELNTPTLRFFRGHIQRNGLHVSLDGYQYQALELSFPAPSGLSGGPVFIDDQDCPIAIVAENHESSTFIRTLSEYREPGQEIRETVHAVVNYALAVHLSSIKDWLLESTSDA